MNFTSSKPAPLVSVIVPNYNHLPFLKQRIDSVLNQTFHDFELLLLDDASTDDSATFLKTFEKHAQVSIIDINTENSGSTFLQWEKGISKSRGKYIWLAESDDFADVKFLEKMVSLLETDEKNVLCFSGSFVVDGRGELSSWDRDKWKKRHLTKKYAIHDGKEYVAKVLYWNNAIYNASAVVFRRDCFQFVSSSYKKMKYCGDWMFWIQVIEQGNVVEVYEKLNYCRVHDQKVSPKAESSGLNIKEGVVVVDFVKGKYAISKYRQRVVEGRFFNSACKLNPQKSPKNAIKEMLRERYRNVFVSYIIYKLHRAVCNFLLFIPSRKKDRP